MDSAEFKRRFMPYYRTLYRVAYSLTGNARDAEDLLHDTFLKLWNKRDRLGDAALDERYLRAVVRNCHIDKLRSVRHHRQVDIEDLQESVYYEPVPEDSRLKELMKLVDKLPARERKLLMAYFIEDIPYSELSKRTGLSMGNIRQIIFRIRKKIQEQWKKKTRP